MSVVTQSNRISSAANIGAILFLLWGILHIWVGYEGVHQYLSHGVHGLWDMVIGGSKAPRDLFQHTTDLAVTGHAHAQLLLNFCIDVGGYGVLGLVVAWLIWTQASWTGYFIGVFIIGIADLTFLFAMVTSGVIELNLGTVGGPVLWFLACLITPFGMPSLRK